MIPDEYWAIGLMTAALVAACVLVHYEGLRFVADRLPRPEGHHRRRVLVLIFFILALHIVEIWMFGLAYMWLLELDVYGDLLGVRDITLIDCIYYSATTYTTIGFGDIYPVGPIRVVTGTEGITGLTMITWSASYTFVQMGRDWGGDD